MRPLTALTVYFHGSASHAGQIELFRARSLGVQRRTRGMIGHGWASDRAVCRLVGVPQRV